MSRENNTRTENRITTDPDTIRSWGERHTLVPVRRESGTDEDLDVVAEDDTRSSDEELSWDEFEREIDREDKVVVHRGEDEYEVRDRSELVGRAPLMADESGESLDEDETVETSVTETSVVEHTVVQETTVQSEITDRETIQSDVVTAELLNSDVDHCTVSRTDAPTETPEVMADYRPGAKMDENYDVEITVDEAWDVTREVVERLTLESRIVESDVDETETVESDTFRETVDIDGVTETVLQGELVSSPETASEAVESGHVESEFRDDDVIETHLIRRQTIEEEMAVRKDITGSISDSEIQTADAATHTVVESELLDESEYDADLSSGSMGATGTDESMQTTGESRTTDESMGATAGESRSSDAVDESGSVDTDTTAGTTSADGTAMPTEEDQGKMVVNAQGDAVGMVADVDDGTMFVDPHPSLTDRIRTALGWGDHDESETYPLDDDHVARIEEEEVVLGVDRER